MNGIRSRRICWPTPDATCLEGGCIWCNDNEFRPIGAIANYAKKTDMVKNRGDGKEVKAWAAFIDGLYNDFFNADIRRG